MSSSSDPWYFDVAAEPFPCADTPTMDLARSPSPLHLADASALDDLPLSRAASVRLSNLTLKHVRTSLPSKLLPSPTAAPKRATYSPGPGRPERYATLPIPTVDIQSPPAHRRMARGDAAWWACAPAAPAAPPPDILLPSRPRASTVSISAPSSVLRAGWMEVQDLATAAGPSAPFLARRSISYPLPIQPAYTFRRTLSSSRRSSDTFPDPPMPIVARGPGQQTATYKVETGTGMPIAVLPCGRTHAEAPARWSIFDRLQPKDGTLERILSEMAFANPSASSSSSIRDPTAGPLGKLMAVSPFIAARRAYHRAVLQLAIALGLLVLFVAIGGSVAAVLNGHEERKRAAA